MFKKFQIGAAGVALIAAFGMATSANAATTASANAQAVILDALSINIQASNPSLNFGTIAVNTGGTVTVAATSGATASCGAGVICSGPSGSVGFDVIGAADQAVGVTLSSPTVSLTGPGAPMTANLNASAASLTLTGGSATLYVGGDLAVAGTQAAGSYSATFDVSVAYQ
jgi:hypothetical protein